MHQFQVEILVQKMQHYLSWFVGDVEDFNTCKEIFEALGTTVIFERKAESGQDTKMANQIVIAGIMAKISEAITYEKEVGLDIVTMLKSISSGSANNAPKMN
jgi:3-hydroxyisobutyrate dehydrogenase